MTAISTGNVRNDRDVVICECFARDGLQHETTIMLAERKIALINRFASVGFSRIEATSFAHPGHVPQFADAEKVLAGITRKQGVRFKATCANLRALERANAAAQCGYGPEEVSFLFSATESHNRRNLNRSRAEQWQLIAEMAAAADPTFHIVGVISVAFGCPFEGAVDPAVVIDDARRLAKLGVRYLTVGDTVGLGNPRTVASLMGTLRTEVPEITFVAHFHNTRGTALANCVAALDVGITHFDASIGGIGGNPAKIKYGEGNTGNAATEDLVVMFESMGMHTGLDLALLMQTARSCEEELGRQLSGNVTRTGYGRPVMPEIDSVTAEK